LATFSAGILTILSALVLTVVSFGHFRFGVHTRFVISMFASLEVSIRCFGFDLFISNETKVAVSLIVCNLAVVITGIYRFLRMRNFLPSAVDPTIHETLSTTPNRSSTEPSRLTFTEISSQRPSIRSQVSLNNEP
jgi:hypothetical protein